MSSSATRPAIAKALGQTALFAGLDEQDLLGLVERATARHYAKGEVILHQDDPAGAFHIVREGRVKIATSSADGRESLLALIGPGQCFGEIAALDGGPRSATVTAIENVETMAVAREDLLAFVRTRPDFALRLIATLATRLRRIDARLEDAHFLGLEARFARLLLDLAEEHGMVTTEGIVVPLVLTQSEIAAMIGATRVSANRLLRSYQARGLIRRTRTELVLLRVEELRFRANSE